MIVTNGLAELRAALKRRLSTPTGERLGPDYGIGLLEWVGNRKVEYKTFTYRLAESQEHDEENGIIRLEVGE
jgi:phage baseplate assembly protein W